MILTSHHGAFFCNNSLALAVDASYFLERAVMIQLEWMKLGKQPDGSTKFKTIPGIFILFGGVRYQLVSDPSAKGFRRKLVVLSRGREQTKVTLVFI